jgi:hypothetical protein
LTFSIQEREKILDELEQSELSVSEFARQKGLSRVLLSVWLYRYRGKAVPNALSGAETVSVSEVPFQEISLNQLLGPPQSVWAAEILLPTGTTVRLDAQGQAQLLQQLLLRLS